MTLNLWRDEVRSNEPKQQPLKGGFYSDVTQKALEMLNLLFISFNMLLFSATEQQREKPLDPRRDPPRERVNISSE